MRVFGYYVWVHGGGAPTKYHPSLDTAEREAYRIAGLNPGKEVLLLNVVSAYKAEKKDSFSADEDSDIPF